MPVTIYDVARHAGVSPRTVSNVVNDFPFVSDDMRARVRASLDELGYRPNLAARSLRSGRTGVVAVAFPDLSIPYFAELYSHIMDELDARGYSVIIRQTNGSVEQEKKLLDDRERSQSFDGIIFSPLALASSDVLPGKGAPVVLLGDWRGEPRVDLVTIDNVAAARVAVEHLISLGRRRIAIIGDQPDAIPMTGRLRTEGYRAALTGAGIAVDDRLIVAVRSFHRDDGAEGMRALLELSEPPDAVFCSSDLIAEGAIRTLLRSGSRVPDDVAIAGFDGIEEGRYSTPTLTTIAPDKSEIAMLAVDQLVLRIEGDTGIPVTRTASFSLTVGESTAGADSSIVT